MTKQIRAVATLCALWPWHLHAKFIDYMDLALLSPPVIQVTGDAQGWQTAVSAPLTFNAQARGRCGWGKRVYMAGTTLRRQAGGNGSLLNHETLVEAPGNNNRTWSSSWKPVSLSWDTDTALRDSAVQACQQALQAREQQGESRRRVLQMGLSTQVAGPSFGFHFFCADHGLASEKQDRYRNATVAVQCQAVNLPDPTPVTAGPSQVAAPQEIKHVSLTVSPAQHHGPCPVTLQLRGMVHHLPTGGQVSQRFVYNGQPLGPFQALPLNPQGTSTPVERTHVVMPPVAQPPHPIVADKAFQPAAPAAQVPLLQQAPTQRVVLEVRHGTRLMQAEAAVSVQCQAPPARQPLSQARPPSRPESRPESRPDPRPQRPGSVPEVPGTPPERPTRPLF